MAVKLVARVIAYTEVIHSPVALELAKILSVSCGSVPSAMLFPTEQAAKRRG